MRFQLSWLFALLVSAFVVAPEADAQEYRFRHKMATDVLQSAVETENLPPVLSGSIVSSLAMGTAYSSALSASDPEGDALFWDWSGSVPPGLSLDAQTGQITGTSYSGGSYDFQISVSDVANNTASANASLFVYDGCTKGGFGTVCQDGSVYVGQDRSERYYLMVLDYPTLPWQDAYDYCVSQGGVLPSHNLALSTLYFNSSYIKIDFFPDYSSSPSNPYWVDVTENEISERDGAYYALTLYISSPSGQPKYEFPDMSLPGEFFCVRT
ncbi:Ig domain-containing protein [Thalassospira xiamenensis]|uniref:Ig domain-containing protein n=1 Tax=Thalassospira xiamenensis TaxID=220697 RepID=A0A285TT14_9PROT|nr:Ig domain-containing protein [Thalassospira xiamenensis]SOC26982.1 Putative Ig domain-containing protein [Thalassospira xiamenensis]